MDTPRSSGHAVARTDSAGAISGTCVMEQVREPCTIVIFGATGDLTSRKLFPALADLCAHQSLPRDFLIVGASRSSLGDADFRERMHQSLTEYAPDDEAIWSRVKERLFYHQLSYDEPGNFQALARFLADLEKERSLPANRLYYVATPPTVYEDIARNLGQAGLAKEDDGYSRIVIEKPFGRDLASARQLDAVVHEHFREHQVFRIDHYLAKETVQNILLLRFANAIFEPLWNRNYIDHVGITAAESIGVEHRAGFYDNAGVLRDMFQNHMMQLLSLCAMEPPCVFSAERVRDEKTKVYRALRPFPVDRIDEHLILGQYSAGMVNGAKVPAYVDEPGVAPDSLTPTYATMKVYVDNWRWQGVPFYITSGKRLTEKRTEIVVQFKEVPVSMFREVMGEHITANRLTLSIQPKEEVSMTFQTKQPGPMCLRTVNMHFDYAQGFSAPKVDAYAKVLLDCMLGDHTLFWRQDGVELCWGFLTPILVECDCPDQAEKLHLYKAGSHGPQAATKLLPDPNGE
ncbi:MAG: glucose-6-phosphate dehydrogenase [Desulfovibrio sp.]|nr:MAG: glucose-6-phosphate dehydrogenase [Desulfovibrio sp.]